MPATVTFGINTTVSLAALEGNLQLAWPVAASGDLRPGPFISRIVPVGVAARMHLSWTATAMGARFVLFAENGAPIPGAPLFQIPREPVLAVTVELPAGTNAPDGIVVAAFDLLGADAQERGVPTCPLRADVRMANDVARICTNIACDFNGDGLANVRDLVTMVHCLRSGTCSDPSRFDCDRDGGFDLDDVLCCAWQMLRPPVCPGCGPDTTSARPEPTVKLNLGSPVITGGEVVAPHEITDADRVGGVRLEFRFPADRYDFVALDGIGPEWLALSDVQGNAIVIGLIRIGEPAGIYALKSPGMNGNLRLRLKPGMSPGGELAAATAEFSGPDGAPLRVEPNHTSLPLSEGMAFGLSDNRPDPFSGVTRFTLTLPAAAEADLGVFDVGGRRVAMIHRGRLAAGVNEFKWNGTSDIGERVASGVYFYRIEANDVASRSNSFSQVKKMLLLRADKPKT